MTATEPILRLCHALSDGTRLEILQRLRHGERCVCDLAEALDAGQSRLSFHLKTLKDAGLVLDRREGRWVYYSINPEALVELSACLASLAPHPERSGGACCA